MSAGRCPACGAAPKAGARFCRTCGGTLPAEDTATSAGLPSGEADPQVRTSALPQMRTRANLGVRLRVVRAAVGPTLRRWARSRRVRLVVGGGLVLVLVVAVGLVVFLRSVNPPDGPVRDFFAALAARDAAKVDQLTECRPASMCGADALRSGYEPPTGVKILEVTYGEPDKTTRRPNKGRATVRVSYELAGATHTDIATLSRTGSGLVRHWLILHPPGGWLDIVSTTVPTAKLGGATVDTVTAASFGRDSGSVYAWPGKWTLAAKETPLVAAVPTTVTVAGGGSQQLTLDVSVRPEVASEVERQIRTRIDTCATKDALRPNAGGGILSNCPFSATTSYVYTKDIRWTIVDYPKIEIKKNDDGSVKVRTVTPGHARVDYQVSTDVLEPRRWTPASDTRDIKISGAVSVDNGSIVWNG